MVPILSFELDNSFSGCSGFVKLVEVKARMFNVRGEQAGRESAHKRMAI